MISGTDSPFFSYLFWKIKQWFPLDKHSRLGEKQYLVCLFVCMFYFCLFFLSLTYLHSCQRKMFFWLQDIFLKSSVFFSCFLLTSTPTKRQHKPNSKKVSFFLKGYLHPATFPFPFHSNFRGKFPRYRLSRFTV